MVAAEVAAVELELRLLQAPAQAVGLGGAGEEIGAPRLQPRLRLAEPRVGGGDLGEVGVDRRGGRVALGGQVAPHRRQLGERLVEPRQLLAPPRGERLRLRGALGDLLPGLAVRLDELLPALDPRREVGLPLVARRHLAGDRVEPLAAGGERRLVAVERGRQLGLARAGLVDLPAHRGEARSQRVPTPGQHQLEEAAVLPFGLLVAARGARLALERAQRALDLGDDVVEPHEVGGRLLELHLGEPLAHLVAGDAGGLFEELAPLLRLAGEDQPDLPLLDHRVGADAEPRVHQQVAHVLEPHGAAVQPVLALAAAEDPPAQGDAAVLGAGRARVGLELESDLGHTERLALLGAVEDDVLHRAAAQALGALLAQHPRHGVGEIALPAPVGPDDRGDPAGEPDAHRIDERLEAGQLEEVEFQHDGEEVGRIANARAGYNIWYAPKRSLPHAEPPMTPEAATFIARNLLFLAGLATAAWATGIPLTHRLPTISSLERHALAATLGLALIGHLAFFLGLVGRLSPLPLLAATALLTALFWVRKRPRSQEPGGSPPPGSSSQAPAIPSVGEPDPARSEAQAGASDPAVHKAPAGSRRRRAAGLLAPTLAIAAIAAAAPFFVLALYPPTAFDATTYHLPMARAFAQSGALPFLPTLRFPVFPALAELLSAIALLFAGDVATHLVQLLAAALTAALLLAWGRHAGAPAAGAVAAGLFLGNPIVAHLAATAYVEMLLTLFVAAALYAADRWRGTSHRGWLALAGVFAGSAAAVKYQGLYFVGVTVLGALALAPRRRRWRAAALVAACALAALLPTHARIAAHTGNPLFPLLPQVFGESAWSLDASVIPAAHRGFDAPPSELARRWARLPLLPWDLVFTRELTSRQPPFSPLYLLALPVLAAGALRERRVRWLLVPVAGWLALFPLLPPDARYLVPVLPLVSLATALSLLPLIARLAERRRAAAVAVLTVLCLLPGWLYAVWRLDRQGPLPATVAARDAYLARALPGYPALRFLDRTCGRRYAVYALHAENHAYFASGSFLGDWFGPYGFQEVLPLLADPAALHARLRALGADHLLLVRAKDYGLADDPAFRRLFLEIYADRHARLFRLAGG